MQNTREKIMQAALELFSQKGYEGTSISDIAARLGITKGALYRHFENKRAVMDAIIHRMEQNDGEKAQENDVPAAECGSDSQSYRDTDLNAVKSFSVEMFDYWTRDSFAAAFRRMISLERYASADMMELYQNYLCAGPLSYMEDLFREMAGKYGWDARNARSMALEFYGAMYLLMGVSDAAQDKSAAHEEFEKYIDGFIERYTGGGDHK